MRDWLLGDSSSSDSFDSSESYDSSDSLDSPGRFPEHPGAGVAPRRHHRAFHPAFHPHFSHHEHGDHGQRRHHHHHHDDGHDHFHHRIGHDHPVAGYEGRIRGGLRHGGGKWSPDSFDSEEHLDFWGCLAAFFFFVGSCVLLLLPFFLLGQGLRRLVHAGRRLSATHGTSESSSAAAPASSPSLFAAIAERRRARAASAAASANGYQALPAEAPASTEIHGASDEDAIVVTGTPVNPPPSVNL